MLDFLANHYLFSVCNVFVNGGYTPVPSSGWDRLLYHRSLLCSPTVLPTATVSLSELSDGKFAGAVQSLAVQYTEFVNSDN